MSVLTYKQDLGLTNTLGNAGLQKKKCLHTNCVAAIGPAGNIGLNPGDSGLTSCGLLFRFLKVSIKTVKCYQTFTQTGSSHNSHIQNHKWATTPFCVQLAWFAPATEDFALTTRWQVQNPFTITKYELLSSDSILIAKQNSPVFLGTATLSLNAFFVESVKSLETRRRARDKIETTLLCEAKVVCVQSIVSER